MINHAPERAVSTEANATKGTLIVTQPKHLENILAAIADVENAPTESQGDARSGDWSGQQTSQAQGDGQDGPTPRDEAIAALPEPVVMQQNLQRHIEQEVKTLRHEAARLTRATDAGAAFELTKLYAKIRRMNRLFSELVDASVDVVKRLFIRVFVDRQAIL